MMSIWESMVSIWESMVGVSEVGVSMVSVDIVVRSNGCGVSSVVVKVEEVSFGGSYLRCVLNWFRGLGKCTAHKGEENYG